MEPTHSEGMEGQLRVKELASPELGRRRIARDDMAVRSRGMDSHTWQDSPASSPRIRPSSTQPSSAAALVNQERPVDHTRANSVGNHVERAPLVVLSSPYRGNDALGGQSAAPVVPASVLQSTDTASVSVQLSAQTEQERARVASPTRVAIAPRSVSSAAGPEMQRLASRLPYSPPRRRGSASDSGDNKGIQSHGSERQLFILPATRDEKTVRVSIDAVRYGELRGASGAASLSPRREHSQDSPLEGRVRSAVGAPRVYQVLEQPERGNVPTSGRLSAGQIVSYAAELEQRAYELLDEIAVLKQERERLRHQTAV